MSVAKKRTAAQAETTKVAKKQKMEKEPKATKVEVSFWIPLLYLGKRILSNSVVFLFFVGVLVCCFPIPAQIYFLGNAFRFRF